MTSRLPEAVLPSEPARWVLLAALATTVGVATSGKSVFLVIGVAIFVISIPKHTRLVAVTAGGFMILGLVSGSLASARTDATRAAQVPEGTATLAFALVEDSSSNRYGVSVGEPQAIDGRTWRGPRLAVAGLDQRVDVGAIVVATGQLRQGVRRVRDEVVAGTFLVDTVHDVRFSSNPVMATGNAIRRRVQETFDGEERSDGLISGLLIGDTRFLGAHDVENLRRSGLAHFVAVSGSNVAVFMLGWWIVTAPLSIRPRIRGLLGLVGLGIFVVVTRWEPSVVRASVMTAVPLIGSTVSIPVDPWMALGTAVTVLLLVSGDLLGSVGFQLSVAATAGVLVGVGLAKGREPRWVWTSLLVTICAQLAVAPIILIVFGSMPLFAPIANLIVAPLVTAATVAGGLSLVVAALEPIAALLASLVLTIAEWASAGPQLGLFGVIVAVLLGSAVAYKLTRKLGLVVALVAVVAGAGGGTPWPDVPMVTVLDVGQGDAILLQDPSGSSMLVDGGSDPAIIDRALRSHGVSKLDVVVATHGDADHVGGLGEIVESFAVGVLWVNVHAGASDLLQGVIDTATRRNTPIREVETGSHISLGGIDVRVVSPQRKYGSDNDGSIVILAQAGRSVLITGDIERTGQAELPDLQPDILIVPHHGSATTDVRWLERVVGEVAIISYGENTYGHPHSDILTTLESGDADVFETFLDGDVSFSLSTDG